MEDLVSSRPDETCGDKGHRTNLFEKLVIKTRLQICLPTLTPSYDVTLLLKVTEKWTIYKVPGLN